MTKQQKRAEALLRHYSNLAALYRIAGSEKSRTGKQLSVRLRVLENEMSRAAENYCSVEGYGVERLEKVRDGITAELRSIFPRLSGLYINSDPRGYALKISTEAMQQHRYPLTTDWGGYGILSPEI